MGPTGDRFRVLQIHPTLRCNLECIHCYSSSGPQHREELSPETLCAAISDAREMGYTVLACSGGEPVLYPHLHAVLAHGHALGMVTTVTSNGMLLTRQRLSSLEGVVDILAISLDGVPASHNRIRGSERAFEVMRRRLDDVRSSGIPFGFIFTLTQYNIHELDWVAGFALEQGASLLQVHPLEEVGRARTLLSGARPDETESMYAFMEVLRIQASGGDRLRVQLDLSDRNVLRADPGRGLVADASVAQQGAFADILSPLIVETDGTVVPLQHGFPRHFALGNLETASLSELADAWRRQKYGAFRTLCADVYRRASSSADLPLFNWYELIAQLAAETDVPATQLEPAG